VNEGANPLHSQVRTCYEPRQAPGTSTKDSFIRIPFVNKSSVAGAIFGCVVEEHFKIYPYPGTYVHGVCQVWDSLTLQNCPLQKPVILIVVMAMPDSDFGSPPPSQYGRRCFCSTCTHTYFTDGRTYPGERPALNRVCTGMCTRYQMVPQHILFELVCAIHIWGHVRSKSIFGVTFIFGITSEYMYRPSTLDCENSQTESELNESIQPVYEWSGIQSVALH
jgi:hypothetical protein